ncbi:MAG TPA: DNA gyrase subunit A [Gammaproteobacteria bacterium]|nr:DNA gyrase subunit A [Gammaproteobacteria bacterium]
MVEAAKEIFPVNLEDEMRQSYLDYAMSVIVGRALPDVRDGLKPVHRRVLYAMRELGNDYNKPYKKSARVVGDVIGKYHPHGDVAVYDTIVRMAQSFSMRYVLVDGQGNFGSVDGDAPAAMRYTEVRMARIAQELLADIDKETVDFVPNYDESENEPTVLPTRVPNLLVNGSAGIAVGMATNIPPHNLGEVIDACLALLDDPGVSLLKLLEIIPGPDFPTAGIIQGIQGIQSAYATGRGRIYVRARTHIEAIDGKGRDAIIVTELPYQVNKARLIEKIAELVREKRIEGITELRDESDKDGMRIVIELRRGELTEVVLNNLYKQTPLQSVFGINIVGLVDGQPRLLPLKELLETFLRHRREVVTRRTLYELRKARERAHVLEGQMVALANIDAVIDLIKRSPSPAEAKAALCERDWEPGPVVALLERAGGEATRPEDLGEICGLRESGYRLSSIQAQAILDLRLHRLTGLEQDKISEEYNSLLDSIKEFLEILSDPGKLETVIRAELAEIRERFADPRRTEIAEDSSELTIEDLIPEASLVVTLSHAGYAKAQPAADYQAQRRGGRGRAATRTRDADFIDKLFVADSHDNLLCFSTYGKVYWLKVYQLPQASFGSRGRPIINLLPLAEDERITAVLPVKEYEEGWFVVFATSRGTVKRTPLSAFSRPRTSGIIAIELRGDDRLVGVRIAQENEDLMLVASNGKAIRFAQADVRSMGRTAAGVRGLKLARPEDRVIALIIVREGPVVTATQHGYGKLTDIDEFPCQGRGGQGVIAIRTTERNGAVVGALQVAPDDELMLISQVGTLVRTPVSDISLMGRNTQGVRLIRLDEGDRLVGIECVEGLQEDDSTPAE